MQSTAHGKWTLGAVGPLVTSDVCVSAQGFPIFMQFTGCNGSQSSVVIGQKIHLTGWNNGNNTRYNLQQIRKKIFFLMRLPKPLTKRFPWLYVAYAYVANL